MIRRDTLRQVIVDQRDFYLDRPIVAREIRLESQIDYCFVGIRRSGKSYMLYHRIQELLSGGIPIRRIVYLNFEDERISEMTAEDLNTILEVGYEIAGTEEKPFLFLDEIQNIDGWQKFARRIADMKYPVFITGSNSRMLSSEMASTLGARYMIQMVYPYSFREYLTANGKEIGPETGIATKDRAEIIRLYDRYLRYGAFPELVGITHSREYLNNIYQTIYLGDIVTRNHITNSFAIRLLLKKIAESVMKPISYSRLHNILVSAGVSIGKQTVINYIGFIKESYLIFALPNYASKLVDREANPKYYFMDTGLLGLFLLDGESAQLENIVAVELIRRYGVEHVYYFERKVEIDFYVPDAKLAIQVCWTLSDSDQTRKREIEAFVKLNRFLPETRYLMITNSEEMEIEAEGIHVDVLPAWKWLLEKP